MTMNVFSLIYSQKFLIFLEKKYKKYMEFSLVFEKEIILNKIFIKKKYRRIGIGSQFMQDLCKYSDMNEIKISLIPVPLDDEIDEERLMKFYKKFGFKKNKKTDYMYRNPDKTKYNFIDEIIF